MDQISYGQSALAIRLQETEQNPLEFGFEATRKVLNVLILVVPELSELFVDMRQLFRFIGSPRDIDKSCPIGKNKVDLKVLAL